MDSEIILLEKYNVLALLVNIWMNFYYERNWNVTAARLTYIDYHESFFFYVVIEQNLDFPISILSYSLLVELVHFHMY